METNLIENDADVHAYVRWYYDTYGKKQVVALWSDQNEKPLLDLGEHQMWIICETMRKSRVQLFANQIDGPLYGDVMKWKTFKGSNLIGKNRVPYTGNLDDWKFAITVLQMKKFIKAVKNYKGTGDLMKIFKPMSEKLHGSPMPKKSRITLE